MARAEQPKLYRNFVKGLITEASFLTYPEDASKDELNTIPSRKGNRTRRLGIDYEDSYVLVSQVVEDTDAVVEFVWKSVNNDASINFLCLQVGSVIKFFSLEADPVSDSLKSFSVNLPDFAAPDATTAQISLYNCEFAFGRGYLFVVHPYCEPIIIDYNATDDDITVTPIAIQIRDFEGVDDGLANDAEPSELTKEHQYNLMNQGWVSPGQYVVPGGVLVDTEPTYYDPYTGETLFYKTGFV